MREKWWIPKDSGLAGVKVTKELMCFSEENREKKRKQKSREAQKRAHGGEATGKKGPAAGEANDWRKS